MAIIDLTALLTLNWRDSSTSQEVANDKNHDSMIDHFIKSSNRLNFKKLGLVSNKSDAPQRASTLSAREFRPHGRANAPSQTLYLRIATQVLFKDKRKGMVKRMFECLFNFLSLHDPDMDIFLILGIRP